MGKKAKSIAKLNKAADKKIDKSTLPPPPPQPTEEVRDFYGIDSQYKLYKLTCYHKCIDWICETSYQT